MILTAQLWILIQQFKVGPNPHGISATADGRTAHIAIENFGGEAGELVWIDTASFKVAARIKVGPKPNENECTPDGKWIYVPWNDGKYWVIDGDAKKVVKKIETGGRPHNTTVSADGRRMYLVDPTTLDRDMAARGLEPAEPTALAEGQVEIGRRVSVNGLYRKREVSRTT